MNYWAVGSSFGQIHDKTKMFLKDGNWFDGKYENGDKVNQAYLEKVNIGDILVIKSSATKGKGHKITFTKLKAIGVVTEIIEVHRYKVDWLPNNNLPLDFNDISYRKTIEPLRRDAIWEYVDLQLNELAMTKLVELLEYKKQIILQGPPGTGKTRLAKELAVKLIKNNRQQTLTDKKEQIEVFFKDYQKTSGNLKLRAKINESLQKFRNLFPKENLINLSLEDYALGLDNNDAFCHWIEYRLVDAGGYNGYATKYKIYFSKSKDEYVRQGFLKNKNSDEEAMQAWAKVLDKVVNDRKSDPSTLEIGKGFVLKLLSTYYPDDYFPINSEGILDKLIQILDLKLSTKSFIDKNRTVQNYFERQKAKYKVTLTNFEFMIFLFSKDIFGEAKNSDNKGSEEFQDDLFSDFSELIQFHPSYTYEDFVRGISVETTKNDLIKYETKNKVFAELAQQAYKNEDNNYVLIIDEINRANLPSVLGELIYALEYRGQSVNSMYKLDNGDTKITIPKNLYIIGTMNTADRSVGHIDYAIRRRFAFKEVLPKELSNLGDKFKKEQFEAVSKLFVQEIKNNSVELEASEHLSPEFADRPQDVWLGHSYFIEQEDEAGNSIDFQLRIDYEIIPILEEYIKDGILRNTKEVKDIIKGLGN